jgi:hypothetical protein
MDQCVVIDICVQLRKTPTETDKKNGRKRELPRSWVYK